MKNLLASMIAFSALVASASGQSIPRPEHPNPQFEREHWLNLNGPWQFWEGDECDEAAALARSEFPDRIVVPFCRESSLSGLGRKGFVKNVIYRRDFVVPADWTARGEGSEPGRVLLHVGACDWRTVVWVNGERVGFHEGGSAPITCDVTGALKPEPGATNELRVWAFDDTRSKLQQCGKQSDQEESYSCVYTRTTGIWQTVWLERVGSARIDDVVVTSEFEGWGDGATVQVSPRIEGPCEGLLLCARVLASGEPVAEGVLPASSHGSALAFHLPAARRWSPSDPFLYSLELSLRTRRPEVPISPISPERPIPFEATWPNAIDVVSSYFGLRTVETRGDAVLLNGKPVFQRLILDQGFYPDGIWTAPSDDALKRDIELSMAAGFNGARLHQKVFEPRFHYWADRLGYLTWGESASWGSSDGNPATHRVVIQEWVEILERDRNHPSIVGWCPFNETGPASAPLQNAVTAITRAIDPTRLLLDTSGYTHSDPARDVDDAHDYDQDPVTFRARWWPQDRGGWQLPARYLPAPRKSPFFVSEFGGIGWIPHGEPGWGYGSVPKSEEEWFTRFKGLCDAQLDNPTLFGFCYTQLTDVEQEKNGLWFYDRRPKFDVARLKAIVARPAAIESEIEAPRHAAPAAPIAWRVLVPSALEAPAQPWRFVAAAAPLAGDGWKRGELGDGARDGAPGFGRKDGFGVRIGTPWTSSDLYLAREVEWDGSPFSKAMLAMHYDNAVTVCLNGEPLLRREGWNDRYEPFDVTERARALLRKGRNVLAVHVHQDGGGQFFDAAVLLAPPASDGGGASPK